MGRKEGGGFRMGNTGIPVADSFRYLGKLLSWSRSEHFGLKESETKHLLLDVHNTAIVSTELPRKRKCQEVG